MREGGGREGDEERDVDDVNGGREAAAFSGDDGAASVAVPFGGGLAGNDNDDGVTGADVIASLTRAGSCAPVGGAEGACVCRREMRTIASSISLLCFSRSASISAW